MQDPLLSQSGSMFGGNTYMRPAWDPSFMIPNSEFEQQAQQDWDPLDPQNLARIADPNLEGTTSCTTPGRSHSRSENCHPHHWRILIWNCADVAVYFFSSCPMHGVTIRMVCPVMSDDRDCGSILLPSAVLPPLNSLRSAEGSGFSPGLTMGPSGLQSPALLATPRGTPTPRAAGGPNSPFLPTEADFSTPPFRSPS